MSSSGELKAGDLKCGKATLKLNSTGNATIWVTDEMNATLVSNGNLKFYGNPQVNSKVVGTGRVLALGEK